MPAGVRDAPTPQPNRRRNLVVRVSDSQHSWLNVCAIYGYPTLMKTQGTTSTIILSLSLAAAIGCSKDTRTETSAAKSELASAEAPVDQNVATKKEAPAPAAKAPAPSEGSQSEVANAKVGSSAPDFTLKDLDGKEVTLASLKGKTVVLEWFNPECPFVQRSHTKGSLITTAKRHAGAGVVWLAINSGAEGRQGHGTTVNAEAKTKFNLDYPILLDADGSVGKAYGATNTPHMFIINDAGVLVYRGAIDNSPDGEGGSPKDGKLVNYVDDALAALKAGKAIATPETEAYGCSVKYAKM